ncbi:MAG: hypothetical protein EHM60_12120, partial [Lysobacterales bacterium]
MTTSTPSRGSTPCCSASPGASAEPPRLDAAAPPVLKSEHPAQPSRARTVSAWSRAASLAARTPESRNRYVDFLRALSIGAVIGGHWLIAAPWVSAGELRLDHMLAVQPWTQWLTLLFQVMPVFFLVGGYSNAASWEAARRSGTPYGTWVAGRARRLIGPIVPLVLAWAALAVVFRQFGTSYEMIRHGSILALVPMWFLAVYLLVVLLVPWTHAA